MAFILRDLDPVFWSRVQTKARAEGQTIKAVILRLLTQWLGVVAAAVAVLMLGACAPPSVAPTPIVVPPIAPATSIALAGGTATIAHEVLFNFRVDDDTGAGVSGLLVTLTTTAGTLNYRAVMTGPSGAGQVILTTRSNATVTARMGDLSATAEGVAYVAPRNPPALRRRAT